MYRVYLLSVVLLTALIQCRERAAGPDVESDRAALARADRALGTGVPSYELFTRTIDDLRNRFGDMVADSRIDALLAREPGYAPAHLVQAESLFRHGRIGAAIVEGNLALEYSGSAASPAQLRAIHSFLDKAHRLANSGR